MFFSGLPSPVPSLTTTAAKSSGIQFQHLHLSSTARLVDWIEKGQSQTAMSSFPLPIPNYRGRQLFGYPVTDEELLKFGKDHGLDRNGTFLNESIIIRAFRQITIEIGSPSIIHYIRVPGTPVPASEEDQPMGLAICTNDEYEWALSITEAKVKQLQGLLGREDAPAWYKYRDMWTTIAVDHDMLLNFVLEDML
ncbi:hypothetical protein Hypma_012557 [Hypsizygus marmoreus]|uniref:Uncharacterized protein n=1 Tax=Hypsizygus marmoreus TaxID=39966 RepID=A0A369JDV6_HYPMA|nr:hypothetical protein Hypma_012557 [Hypsizygus marmoreus]